MKIVTFKFDKEKDLFNIWETCNSELSYGYDFKKYISKDIIKICKGKKFEECKKELIKKRDLFYKKQHIKMSTQLLDNSWASIEKEYFKRLEKITKEEFPFKRVNAYLTTSQRCPYRPHWRPPAFYSPFLNSLIQQLQAGGHELMHIHLHNINWWEKTEKEIGYKKTHDLKEALTELLNLEFKDLWFSTDFGYPNHKKLRLYINKQWKKEKDFNKLTDNCIKWIKRYGVK